MQRCLSEIFCLAYVVSQASGRTLRTFWKPFRMFGASSSFWGECIYALSNTQWRDSMSGLKWVPTGYLRLKKHYVNWCSKHESHRSPYELQGRNPTRLRLIVYDATIKPIWTSWFCPRTELYHPKSPSVFLRFQTGNGCWTQDQNPSRYRLPRSTTARLSFKGKRSFQESSAECTARCGFSLQIKAVETAIFIIISDGSSSKASCRDRRR